MARAGTGIIPARAGFTRPRNGGGRRVQDHPRSRGVYLSARVPVRTEHGSSPLARGLRPDHAKIPRPTRIIPARAGFTLTRTQITPGPQDHPRSRGVYRICATAPITGTGSSPLARGLLSGAINTILAARIIPARAGFTYGRPGHRRGSRDHPRSRGVYWRSRISRRTRTGSSPLARGLHTHGRALANIHGIIPARAGFTSSGARSRS